MRVLTFIHSFEPGGVERVALRLVKHWRELGVDAPLLIGRDEGDLRDELDFRGNFDVLPPDRFGSAWRETLWMMRQLPAHVRRLRPDIVFSPGNTYGVVAVALRLVLGASCPPIIAKVSNDLARTDMHPVPRLFWRAWLRIQATLIDGWIVIDEGMAADFRAHLREAPFAVIPNPVLSVGSIVPVARIAPRCSGRRFVAVGRLVRQKNYQLMLRAFALAARAGDSLTIFGDGPQFAGLRRLAKRLGIADRVHWCGHVGDAAAQLCRYDVLLLSSLYEGVPAAVAEAMASGIAVVATDCGPGLRGLTRNGALARLVAPDLQELAGAIATATRCDAADMEECASHLRSYAIEHVGTAYLRVFASGVFARAAKAIGRAGPAALHDRLSAVDRL